MGKTPTRAIRFWVAGLVPSKSNFRRSGKSWREEWGRIVAYETDVKKAAMAAGGRKLARGGRVEVFLGLYNQNIDSDNAWKSTLDGMEGVCYEKDKVVKRGSFDCVDDDGGPRVLVAVRLID